jgi:tetratricopeptide (TPR) repeat protein
MRRAGRAGRVGLVFALAAVVLAGCAPKPVIQPRTASSYDIEVAVTALRQGQTDDAIRLLTKSLDSPDLTPQQRALALANRASAYLNEHRPKEAVADADAALQLDPKLLLALMNRASAQLTLEHADVALADYDAALAIQPGFAELHLGRGEALAQRKDLAGAIAEFTQAISIKPYLAEPYDARGQVYLDSGDEAHARADFDQAVKVEPGSIPALEKRAWAAIRARAYDQAIADYDAAVQLAPDAADPHARRGFALFIAGRFDGAADDLAKSLAIKPGQTEAVLWLHLARQHLKQDDRADFTTRAGHLDLRRWPGPIVAAALAGTLVPADILASAATDASGGPAVICRAAFYLGEDALLHRQPATAAPLLKQAAEACPPPHYIEQAGAAAELARLGR